MALTLSIPPSRNEVTASNCSLEKLGFAALIDVRLVDLCLGYSSLLSLFRCLGLCLSGGRQEAYQGGSAIPTQAKTRWKNPAKSEP